MRTRSLLLKLSALLVAGGLVLPSAAKAEDLKIQAMPLGSSWYVFGATLSKLLQESLPAGSTVDVVAKGGGVGNVISVSNGQSQIGLANVATAVWAYNGDPVVYKGKSYKDARSLVGGLNPVWFNAMVSTEFMEKTGQKTLEEILTSGKPVRIAMKPPGSTVPVVADMLFASLGIDRDAIKKAGGEIIQVAASQLPTLVRDGRTDIYFESTPRGHPSTTEAMVTGKVVFLDLPTKSIDYMVKQGLASSTMPAIFPNQSEPTKSVDFGTQLIANKDVSDDLAYLVTKTVCENKDAMAQAHKAWSNFNPEVAWKPENTGIPLHPGAERYYKERGWMK